MLKRPGIFALTLAILLSALFGTYAFAANVAEIKAISVQEYPDKDQVTITADMPVALHEVKSPTQIIIDIPNSKYDAKGKVQLVLNKTVKLYRAMNLENTNPKTTRIIVIMNESLPSNVYKQNNQIIIDIDKSAIIERMETKIAQDTSDKGKKGSNTLVEYHYNQGKTFSRLGKWNEAVDEYLKALKIDPANDKIKLSLDVAKNNLKSEREIDKAVKFYQEGEYNEAIRAFIAITNMWPQDISAYFHLGKSYLKLNKYREAVTAFEKVMEINPDYDNVKELYELAQRRKTLNNFNIELKDQEILDVLKTLLKGSGYNLMVEDGVKNKKISIALVDKTLDEALNEVIIKNGYKYEKTDNIIKLMPNVTAPEDRVYSQMNLTDLEIGHGLEVLSRLMEKNIILDESVEKVKNKKVTFMVRDELTIKEIFDLLLKTNDLVSIPYYENTYIIMTKDEAKKNNKYSRKEYHVYKVTNSKPSDLKKRIFESKILKDNLNEENVGVDDDKNIITIFDTPENVSLLTSVLSKNDIKEQQVTISVKILEVSKDAKKALGLYLKNMENDTTINSQTPFRLNVKNLGKISLTKLDAQLDMLENDSSVKTLASPITRVIDKETATIQSGKNIPVKDVVQNPQYEGGKIVGYTSQETWTTVNVGIELKVKPTIHHDGEVTLDVNVTQNDADTTNLSLGSHFVTTGKSTKTILRVKDGETIVMGGLINSQEGGAGENLPFFNRIPIVGRLFQRNNNYLSRSELIIFLTAFLVNKPDSDEKESQKITTDLMKYSTPERSEIN